MRVIAVVSWLVVTSGCDLVFPLQAPTSDGAIGDGAPVDAPTIDADPSQPMGMFTVSPDPLVVGAVATVTLHLTGTQSATVYYDLTSSPGAFNVPVGSAALVGGSKDVSLSWMPPLDFTFVTLDGMLSYDPGLVPHNNAGPAQFTVVERFGHPEPLGSRPVIKETLIAFQINIPKSGKIASISVSSQVGTPNARLGLYTDSVNAPAVRVAQTGSFAVAPGVQTFATDFLPNMTLPAGLYWLAFLADNACTLDGTTTVSPGAQPINVFGFPFGNTLPMQFPNGGTNTAGTWGLYVTLAP